MASKKSLGEVIDGYNFKLVTQKLMSGRKVHDENTVTYEEVEHQMGDKILKVRGTHIPLEEIFKYASGNCKMCSYGKGYFISEIAKTKYPNPRGLMVLEPVIPEGLSEDQKKIYEERIKNEKTWRIANTCRCASEKALKKNLSWVANENRNVFIDLDYEFVEDADETNKEN